MPVSNKWNHPVKVCTICVLGCFLITNYKKMLNPDTYVKLFV